MSSTSSSSFRWSSWRRDALWMAAYVPLALLFTWPLAARFAEQLAGDHGDAWQNLWNIDWIWRSLWHLKNPFHTDALWHPDGATLVFQTFDLPDAIWSAPLLPLVGPKVTYNLVVLGTYIFSGWSMYLLSRGSEASRPASFFAGCAYTFSTYHFGHSLGHLHIIAMQWVPLFVLAWWRILEGRGWRWAVAGGVFLALSALSSWYYLLNAFLIAAGILLVWTLKERGRGLVSALARIGGLCGVFLALVGPLLFAMLRARATESVGGEHKASWFSSDIQSFFLPNAAQALARWSPQHRQWHGNAAETATYLGAVLLILVLVGLALRAKRTGAYLVVALIGIILALGPKLLWGGRALGPWELPYAYLERAVPPLQFMGVPVRFGFCATLALAAALAPALDALASRLRWRYVAPLALVAIAEHAPNPFVTSNFPVPAPMRAWAQDSSDFAVLDACRDMRPLWHQMHHGHPIKGGYLTRTPTRLEKKLEADPVAGTLLAWDPPVRSAPLTAEVLDFPFHEPVVPGAERTRFSFELRGTLEVREETQGTFIVESDDGAELFVDDRRIVDNRGSHPAREANGAVTLTKGTHALRLRYEQHDGGAVLRAWWQPKDGERRLLGPIDVPGGFSGTVRFRRRELRVTRDAALAHLNAERIRYIVQMDRDSRYPTETQLGLIPVFTGDGVRIYEVPRTTNAVVQDEP